MKMLNKSLKAMGIAALLASSSALAALPGSAQSLSDILRAVESDSRQLTAEDQQRLSAFRSDRNTQAAQLAEARRELNAATARGNTLGRQFDANEGEISAKTAQLIEEAGEFGQLVGEFNTAVSEVSNVLEESLANFEYGNRVEGLRAVAQSTSLPSREELDRLPKAILTEMIAQSEVKEFTATVANEGADGEVQEATMTRVGVFTAAVNDGTRFVDIEKNGDGTYFLQVLGKQPTGRFRSAMSSLISAPEGTTVTVPFDVDKGELFRIEGDKATLSERIGQGGVVGYIILSLLAIGAIFALFKIVTLFLMGGAMRSTAKTKTAGDGNPLARIFETYETNKNADLETLELKLDEQILRESPKIERFNDIVKVLAAIAPLLGLLGTVIGMIITFTAITNFGAGDPKQMAGGISTALMTTVLGLVAAIPLLLLHAVAASMARGNQQVLDEQAAGLVAERAERGQGTA